MADTATWMVEVNLTSNGRDPECERERASVHAVQEAGVPVALSTDDEGVSRIDLTHEYVRAADTYPLSYHDLKLMVRTSIQHSFLPVTACGSAWTPEKLETPVAACRGHVGAETPARSLRDTGACQRKGTAGVGTGAQVSHFRGELLSEC